MEVVMADCSSIERQRDAYIDLLEKQMEKSRSDIEYAEETQSKVDDLKMQIAGLDAASSDPEVVRQLELLNLDLKDAEIEAKWAHDRAQPLKDMINEFAEKVNEFSKQLEDCEKQDGGDQPAERKGWLRM
jgi:chromosome segregation ATPase